MSSHKDKAAESKSTAANPKDAVAQSAADQNDDQDQAVILDGDAVDDYGKLLAEKQELMNTLLRRQADFENYRKRVEKERHQERHRGTELLIEQLIPVLDTFDRALQGAGEGPADEYRKGFELIRRQMWDVLSKQGLVRIESVGKEFDPNFHHAIGSVETSEHPDGSVVEELQPGYLFHERVVRPAMVRVAKAVEAESPKLTRRGN